MGEGEGTVDSYDNTSPKSVFGAYDDNYYVNCFWWLIGGEANLNCVIFLV